MALIDLGKLPENLSFRDMLEPTEYMFGDDFDAPLGDDDEEIAWEGTLIDGYPVREMSVEEVRERRKEASRERLFDDRVRKELPSVPPAPESVRLYVARIRTAARLRIPLGEVHRRFYGGKSPRGLEILSGMGFAKEASAVLSVKAEPDLEEGEEVRTERADPRMSQWAEARKTVSDRSLRRRKERGRDAGFAREEDLLRVAADMTSGFAQNDKVKIDDGTDTGVIDSIDSGGKIKVRRDAGGTIDVDMQAADSGAIKRAIYDPPFRVGEMVMDFEYPKLRGAYEGLRDDRVVVRDRQTGKIHLINVTRAVPVAQFENPRWEGGDRIAKTAAGVTHAPKGTHHVGDPEEGAIVDAKDDVTNKKNPPHLRPDDCALVATLRWPNVSVLSAAIPKLAARDWISGIGKEVDREGGSWIPEPEAYELSACFPSQESARRFAKRLVEVFHVRPASIEATMEAPDPRRMRLGLLRVDMARRVILPGGIVFALEGAVQPGSFQVGDGVIVMDPMSQAMAEGVVAAVSPDVAVVTASDGSQYEYTRGYLRKLTLARLSLLHGDEDLLGQRVAVGEREGTLFSIDGDTVRVRFGDGPRRILRGEVEAIVRVADLGW